MIETTFTIDLDQPIGVISPRLYGHFAEFLGRCCYDGLWVGTDNKQIAHHNGHRLDVLQALQRLPVTLLRWPGGCYADRYHWRDGIGPIKERPRRLGMSCGLQAEDDNSMGTHEFLELCALLGAEPYLAGNVGTGTPQELCDWMEYCNSSRNTTLSQLRAANGSSRPFNVRLWGVGNENWGCGGNYEAVDYAREYRRYATMLRDVDPSAELVLCGHNDAWNIDALRTVTNHSHLVDHLSIHCYWTQGGPELAFSETDYYALLSEATQTETFIERTTEIIQQEIGNKRRIGIALDEWGVWHPENRSWGPPDNLERRPVECNYEQAGTLRDALAAGIAFEAFHRQCNVLSMANLAQIVNVLQAVVMTQGNAMWLTPTYYTFLLHKPHIGATAVTVHTDNGSHLADGSAAVSATASRNDKGTAITIINRHFDQSAQVQVRCSMSAASATSHLLTADHANAANDANTPDNVKPIALQVIRESGGDYLVELPPHSLATIVLA